MLPRLKASFRDLQDGRTALVSAVTTLSPEAQLRPLREGAWSPLQNLEHVMLVEKSVLRSIRSGRDPGRRTFKGKVAKALMWCFFVLRMKTKVPIPEVFPQETPDLEEVLSSWDTVREDLAVYLEMIQPEILLQPVVRHPAAGAMHIEETLRFLKLHLDHHRRHLSKRSS